MRRHSSVAVNSRAVLDNESEAPKHYAYKLAVADGFPCQRWQVIKELLHSNDCPTNSDPVENQRVCDEFLTFFSDKILKISAKIRHTITSGILPKTTQPTFTAPEFLGQFDAITVNDRSYVIFQ